MPEQQPSEASCRVQDCWCETCHPSEKQPSEARSETPYERAARDPYYAGMREAIQVVQRAVVPLGGCSPWNDGYTRARNEAVAALIAACSMLPEPPQSGPSGGSDRG